MVGTDQVASDGARRSAFEDIIKLYLRDVDRTLIRQNLALTPGQRLQKLEEFLEFLESAKKKPLVHVAG